MFYLLLALWLLHCVVVTGTQGEIFGQLARARRGMTGRPLRYLLPEGHKVRDHTRSTGSVPQACHGAIPRCGQGRVLASMRGIVRKGGTGGGGLKRPAKSVVRRVIGQSFNTSALVVFSDNPGTPFCPFQRNQRYVVNYSKFCAVSVESCFWWYSDPVFAPRSARDALQF